MPRPRRRGRRRGRRAGGDGDAIERGEDELLVRYGKMAAAGAEVGGEKEDIAYLVVLVSGLGNSIKYEH